MPSVIELRRLLDYAIETAWEMEEMDDLFNKNVRREREEFCGAVIIRASKILHRAVSTNVDIYDLCKRRFAQAYAQRYVSA